MSDRPTRAEVEALIALAGKTAPEPWDADEEGTVWVQNPAYSNELSPIIDCGSRHDAVFIAAAHNLLPALARSYLAAQDREVELVAQAAWAKRDRDAALDRAGKADDKIREAVQREEQEQQWHYEQATRAERAERELAEARAAIAEARACERERIVGHIHNRTLSTRVEANELIREILALGDEPADAAARASVTATEAANLPPGDAADAARRKP